MRQRMEVDKTFDFTNYSATSQAGILAKINKLLAEVLGTAVRCFILTSRRL